LAFLLLRVPSLTSPAGSFRCRLTYPGSLPSSRHYRSASTRREGCHALASFRPQVFATSRRFSPPSGFAGFFHPAATSRVVAVQGLLSSRSGAGSSPAHSPLPLSPRALTGHCLGVSLSRPAGRRMPRSGCLDFEAFLRARQRCLRFGYQPHRSPLPSSVFISSRSSTTALVLVYPKPPAPDVASGALNSLRLALSVFQRQPRFLGLPRNQPARDFRAFRLKSPWLPRSTRLPALSRSGASLPAQRRWLITSPCPLAVVTQSPHRTLLGRFAFASRRPPDATLWMPRLRGLPPREVALPTVWGSAKPQPAPLFGFHLLQVVLHRLGFGLPKTSRSRRCLRGFELPSTRPQRISAAG